MSRVYATRADAGGVIRIPSGGGLVVELDENPTTGYRWEDATTGAMWAGPSRQEFVPAPGGAAGGGGIRRFTFDGLRPGAHRLVLHLRRAWERDRPPLDRFEAMVAVEGEMADDGSR